MQKVSRNDRCPCGSEKKYKKCCMDADSTSLASLNSTTADAFFPASFRTAEGTCLPAIVGVEEANNKSLFVLARPSRPLNSLKAGEEASSDLFSTPGSGADFIGPDCLRYLWSIGYRIIPGLSAEDENVELLEDLLPDEDDMDDDAVDETIDMLHDAAEQQIIEEDPPEVRQTLVRLRRAGHSRTDIMDMIVHLMMHESVKAAEENGEVNLPRYVAALARLPQLDCAHDPPPGSDDN